MRAWEYRQLDHAKGAWYRLRRLLADAREAYAVAEDEASRLLGEGLRAEPAGAGIEPPKIIVFAPRQRLERIAGRRRLALHLDAELMAARAIVLVPWEVPGIAPAMRPEV